MQLQTPNGVRVIILFQLLKPLSLQIRDNTKYFWSFNKSFYEPSNYLHLFNSTEALYGLRSLLLELVHEQQERS
jgi:hypothetical protein